jgi:hypothetical protein
MYENYGNIIIVSQILKSPVFWVITQCRPLKVTRRFGGTRRLHPHGSRIIQASDEHEEGSKQSHYIIENRSIRNDGRENLNSVT